MQIRYKITLIYTVTVATIFLLLCVSVYFLSAQDREAQFRERLRARGIATYQLLSTEKVDVKLLRKLAQYPSAALRERSISFYDSLGNPWYANNDEGTEPVHISPERIRKVAATGELYFNLGQRDALAFKVGKNVVLIAAFDDDRITWLEKLRFILVLSFFVSVALVMVVGYFFSLQLVTSISRISTKVNHITSRDLSLRLDVGKNRDELEHLAETINGLLERLQHSFETQSRFIDNASHELSTPLAVILSQLEVAKQKSRSKEAYEQLVDSVYEDVSRLDVLVKSLLDLAKISGSQNGLELHAFRIDDLLMQLPADMRKINNSYKVKLVFEEFPEDEEHMKVYGNEALLFCAFHNIVHNACKYAPDHACIVKLTFVEDMIRIMVQDYGPGIEDADMPYIFQPFYRSINVNTTIQGTGLGLPLANNIIKLHNGNISVTTVKGAGTTFRIDIKQRN